MPISNSDSRWVWELDPKRPFGELTKYTGNRQVTNLPLVNFTNAGALPTNDGVNQIHERVLDPHGSGEYVYRTQIRADRADGDGSVSGGYANGTFRSEISNTMKTPQWGIEYWCAFAVRLLIVSPRYSTARISRKSAGSAVYRVLQTSSATVS